MRVRFLNRNIGFLLLLVMILIFNACGAAQSNRNGEENEKTPEILVTPEAVPSASVSMPVVQSTMDPLIVDHSDAGIGMMRQEYFDNWTTTDDHGMVLCGIYKDQRGNKFYKVKNSWGTKSGKYDGYFYASVPFVKMNTTSIMINKNSIPKDIRKKLSL